MILTAQHDLFLVGKFMPDSIIKNADGNLEIQPSAVLPPKVIITGEKAKSDLAEAKAEQARCQTQMLECDSNVAQKQKVFDDCKALGVVVPLDVVPGK